MKLVCKTFPFVAMAMFTFWSSMASADAPLGRTSFLLSQDSEKFIIILDWDYIGNDEDLGDLQTIVIGSYDLEQAGIGTLKGKLSNGKFSYKECEVVLNNIDETKIRITIAGGNTSCDDIRYFDGLYSEKWNTYGEAAKSP